MLPLHLLTALYYVSIMRRFLIMMSTILGIALVCFSCTDGSGKTLTLKEMKSIKRRVLEGKTRNILTLLDLKKLNSVTVSDMDVIEKFFREEVVNAQDDYDIKSWRKIRKVLDPLEKVMVKSGGQSSVKLFVDWVTIWDWENSVAKPLKPAALLVGLSNRVKVSKDQIQHLLQSKDPEISSMAHHMWEIIAFENVPTDIKRVLSGCANLENFLIKEAGAIKNWEEIAVKRGYDLRERRRADSLKEFIIDCEKRINDLQEKYERGALRVGNISQARSQERLWRLRALQQLVRIDRDKAFECLVKWLGMGSGWSSSEAAYHLHELTGHHFAVYAYIDYKNMRTGVLVNQKAADAWRKWYKTRKFSV